uniref:Intraflagellar transport protein 56 n=1 Tax=Haemonchus contortus TaxID=6289 RepID=A0A7I4Y5F7_HAECO
MLLSRLRPAKKKQSPAPRPQIRQQIPDLEEFLIKKDYTAAISLLEFKQKNGEKNETTDLWLGHCFFRSGDYRKALEVYEDMKKQGIENPDLPVYLGICFFYLGMYEDAKLAAEKAERSPLQNRLLFHVSHKLGEEKRLMQHHQLLGNVMEDQLSLASIHYMRMHYMEAIEIYKTILQEHTNMIALNVYMAMCYYKMDYFDVAQEVLSVYLRSYADSPAALNLKACITFKIYNGKAALPEVEQLQRVNLYPAAREILRHNQVVFRDGDGALQVFPGLMDTLPEARVNLILYHLKREDIDSAMTLCNDLEPQSTTEFLVKAIVFAFWGQLKESKDHLKTAEQFFKMVGESPYDTDTIPGRQSMACSLFLSGKYEDALVYLNSIQAYHHNDDVFSFNIAQTEMQCGMWKEAEEHFLAITGPDRDKPVFKYMLTKTLIMNHKPQLAWDIYTRSTDPKESFNILRIIAMDCYSMGEYYYAAKAFDGLEKIDPSPENWQGKRGATSGLFKMLVQGKATNEQMSEVLQLLDRGNHPQADFVSSTIRRWAKNHEIALE